MKNSEVNIVVMILVTGMLFLFTGAHAVEGDFVWARSMGGTWSDGGQGIAIDSENKIYITGYFSNTVDFDPGPGTYNLISNGDFDIFVVKFDASGNLIWAKSMGGTTNDSGTSIVVDTADNVYVTGSFYHTVDFDPGPGTFELTSPTSCSIFILKLDSAGNFVWAKAMGGASDGVGSNIILDSMGNIYTTGYFKGTADFDPGEDTYPMTSAGGWDIFVSKLNADGSFLWAKRMGSTGEDNGYGITIDLSGNCYITGGFEGTVDFNPGDETFFLTSSAAQYKYNRASCRTSIFDLIFLLGCGIVYLIVK